MASKVIRKVIHTSKAPAAVGPYSQAVQSGDLLFISGQVGMDPATTALVEGGVVPQAERALINIGAILEDAGCTYKNVVKTTVLVADINDYAAVNKVYSKYFSESVPARAAYQVAALPMGAKVEIEAVARVEALQSKL